MTDPYKVIVVDDEPLAISRATRMVNDLDHYQVVASAGNYQQALQSVQQHQPDIVLLDIEMPGENGLKTAVEIAKLEPTPVIIFCTAYENYAIDAFKTLASGYLLKPLKLIDLEQALAKTKSLIRPAPDISQGKSAFLNATQERDAVRLAVNDILYFAAAEKMVFAHSQAGDKTSCCVVDKSLDQLETELGDAFLRVHRNCLVAVRHIKRQFRDGTGKSWLSLGKTETPVQISRRNLSRVKALFRN